MTQQLQLLDTQQLAVVAPLLPTGQPPPLEVVQFRLMLTFLVFVAPLEVSISAAVFVLAGGGGGEFDICKLVSIHDFLESIFKAL